MSPGLQATLIEGNVAKQLQQLALPMVWGLLATMSMNAVEALYISKLGRDHLAAFTFTFPVVMVLMSFGIGLGAGTSSAVARAIGEGNQHKARRLATDAMSLTFFIAVCVSLLGWLTIDRLFSWMGATADLLPLIRSYMTIWYISAPCLLVPMVCLAALRAMGMSQTQGVMMAVAALVTIMIDPIFIFGWGPVPAMGLAGAAYVTLIVRLCMLLVALYWLVLRLGLIGNPIAPLWDILRSWQTITHVGLPAMIANVIIPVAGAIVVRMMSQYGPDAVAGLGVAMRIEPIALIVFYALSGVIGPFFGQNFGAQRIDRLFDAVRILTRFSLILGALLALLLGLFGKSIAGLFGGHEAVAQIAASYLVLAPLSYGAYGIIMSINAAFNGVGKPMPSMVLSAARVLFIFLPVAWLCQIVWGMTGVFVAATITNLLVGLWGWLWMQNYLKSLEKPLV